MTIRTRRRRPGPPGHRVCHCYWKYPVIAIVLAGVLVVLAVFAGSPDWPRATIAGASRRDPGGTILAFTQELDGTASSWMNAPEQGVGRPDSTFVIDPLRAYAPLLGASVQRALGTWEAAGPRQRHAWASNYDRALATIEPGAMGSSAGMASAMPSPDFAKIGMLRGDFGPVPAIVQADLGLARRGYLEQYLIGTSPGHSMHLTTIWLYDQPLMLNTAVANGLTDDQWGMVKERGFPVGPWYLILPAVAHVLLPGGSTGTGFLLWNLAFALFFMFAVPFLPGLRDLPERLRLHRLMYRYPAGRRSELGREAETDAGADLLATGPIAESKPQ